MKLPGFWTPGWLAGMALISILAGTSRAGVFFEERFEDANLKARGWYDNTAVILSSAEHLPGSSRSAEFHWRRGATGPDSGGAFRRKFTPSISVYVSYWVKYSTNYTGSNKPYHPHEFNLLTTENSDWAGPAFTHLTGYIEQNEGVPVLSIQDGENIDQSRIGQDLRGVTEHRSVAGCNGTSADGYTTLSCYKAGSAHWNGKSWKAAQAYFQDAPGPLYKANWSHVEAFFKLNTISNGVGQPDGHLKYWHNGKLLIDRTNVLMRTGARPNMKWNQLLIAPYIGDGSPVDQAMWIDDLTVASERPVADTDGDGMPDDWEDANDLNRADPSDARGDADGDGFPNRSEFVAGTDPKNAASLLRIDSAESSGGTISVRFQSAPGKSYELEERAETPGGSWLRVRAGLAGDGGILEVALPQLAAEAARFYRIRLSGPQLPAT